MFSYCSSILSIEINKFEEKRSAYEKSIRKLETQLEESESRYQAEEQLLEEKIKDLEADLKQALIALPMTKEQVSNIKFIRGYIFANVKRIMCIKEHSKERSKSINDSIQSERRNINTIELNIGKTIDRPQVGDVIFFNYPREGGPPCAKRQCLLCGVDFAQNHHIISQSAKIPEGCGIINKDDQNNLIPLCQPHHQGIHDRWLTFDKTDVPGEVKTVIARSCDNVPVSSYQYQFQGRLIKNVPPTTLRLLCDFRDCVAPDPSETASQASSSGFSTNSQVSSSESKNSNSKSSHKSGRGGGRKGRGGGGGGGGGGRIGGEEDENEGGRRRVGGGGVKDGSSNKTTKRGGGGRGYGLVGGNGVLWANKKTPLGAHLSTPIALSDDGSGEEGEWIPVSKHKNVKHFVPNSYEKNMPQLTEEALRAHEEAQAKMVSIYTK